MKILLIGEYSNVHWTLAEGLRAAGHKVCVLSNGDFWKNYKRDISLIREEGRSFAGIKYMLKAISLLPQMRGYDIVQLINPMFLELKAKHIVPFYKYLRRNNSKIFLGAMGMDALWVKAGADKKTFRYSDFNIGDRAIDNESTRELINDWSGGTDKEHLNYFIADDCDGIIAGMYEYHTAYKERYGNKLTYIPMPMNLDNTTPPVKRKEEKIKFFIGIQKSRSQYKGTDIMMRALLRIKENYPDRCEILKAENVPFEEYSRMIEDCDVLLDQLYGYSPGMNALLALAKGKIVVGGAEEEYYELLNEKQLRPMVNVTPDEEDVYKKLEQLILTPKSISHMQEDSYTLVKKHHDYRRVAKMYLDFWNSKK
ncbi:MAG: glycosyltransferase family 4 protein [Bacteroidales bacterium]|nr:glycosyltransferase family 4 protein [Bacteroidales bacterium]